MTLKLKKMTIFLFTILLVVMMILFSLYIGNILNRTLAYILTFCVYWFVFCIPISLYYLDGIVEIKSVYICSTKLSTLQSAFIMLAFMPCIATFCVVFINILSVAPVQVFLIAVLFAIINGVVEELFWRGIFISLFPKNIMLGYILPTFLFGLWHIALFLSKGIVYQGNFITLIGGSMCMGFLWGFIAYKSKVIKIVTIAHVVTNFFAFSGLIYENWFML